jgi:hypothetical protein
MDHSNLMEAYLEAYRLACIRLSECESDTVCMNTKAVVDTETNTYTVKYFDRECKIKCADGAVTFESDAELSVPEKVLVLHYLIDARPAHLTGEAISFQEVPEGGLVYYAAFKKRAINPLVKTFSKDLDGLGQAAKAIGGHPEKFGDVSVSLYVLPLVPVTYVIWQGDEEIAPSGTILFDSSVGSFLPVEDIALAASYGTYRLMGEWRNRKGQQT